MSYKNLKLHRNYFQRFYGSTKIYFIVTKTEGNFPYFEEVLLCDLLIEQLRLCKKLKGFFLYAFSIMYDHLNLLIRCNETYNISKVIQSIKKEFSRNANYILINNFGEPSSVSEHSSMGEPSSVGGISQCRRLANSKQEPLIIPQSQFQQLDAGRKIITDLGEEIYTPNLKDYCEKFDDKYGKDQILISKFQWQEGFWDRISRAEKEFLGNFNYIEYNHKKHNLPDNWKYTSLRKELYTDLLDKLPV